MRGCGSWKRSRRGSRACGSTRSGRQSGRMAAQQRMLRSVIEALPDPIMVVDQEMTIVQANGAARRSFDAPAPPVPLARVLRDPGVLAAVTGALAGTSA